MMSKGFMMRVQWWRCVLSDSGYCLSWLFRCPCATRVAKHWSSGRAGQGGELHDFPQSGCQCWTMVGFLRMGRFSSRFEPRDFSSCFGTFITQELPMTLIRHLMGGIVVSFQAPGSFSRTATSFCQPPSTEVHRLT